MRLVTRGERRRLSRVHGMWNSLATGTSAQGGSPKPSTNAVKHDLQVRVGVPGSCVDRSVAGKEDPEKGGTSKPDMIALERPFDGHIAPRRQTSKEGLPR